MFGTEQIPTGAIGIPPCFDPSEVAKVGSNGRKPSIATDPAVLRVWSPMSRGHGRAERFVLDRLAEAPADDDIPPWVTVELLAAQYTDPDTPSAVVADFPRFGKVLGLSVGTVPKVSQLNAYYDDGRWVRVENVPASGQSQRITCYNADTHRWENVSVESSDKSPQTQHIPSRAAVESVRRAVKKLDTEGLLQWENLRVNRDNPADEWIIRDGELHRRTIGIFMLGCRRRLTDDEQAIADKQAVKARAESEERLRRLRAIGRLSMAPTSDTGATGERVPMATEDDGCVCTMENCAGKACKCPACIEQAGSYQMTCHCDICDDGT